MNNLVDIVKELSDANGAPGFEEEVLEVIKKHTEGIGNISVDKFNNLYLERKTDERSSKENKRVKIQLDAHTDEVAFMTRNILPNGMISFTPLGGWVDSNIPAHTVRVRSRDNKYYTGLIASKPPHFMSAEEREKGIKVSSMVIDLGVKDLDELKEMNMAIGEPVVPDVTCSYDKERDLFLGKAFDCRMGCAAIIGTMERIMEKSLDCDVIGAFSTQEEVGSRGAAVTSRTVKPDLCIVFEGCPADDTFEASYISQTKLKHGPMLRHLDAKMITHPRFQRYALKVAKDNNIPVQEAVRTGGSTNGAPIHISNNGVPTIVIGIPVRYIHTHYCYASLYDLKHSIDLAVEIIKSMNMDTYERL